MRVCIMCFLNCCLTPSGWSHLWLSLFFSAVALSLTSSIQQIHCGHINRQKTECQLVSILYPSPPPCIALTFCNVFITAPRSDLANHHIWDLTILPRIPLCGRSRSSGVIPYHTIPGHTLPYHARSYLTIPYQVIPYHTMPGHTLPCHTRSYLPQLWLTSPFPKVDCSGHLFARPAILGKRYR